MNSVKPFQTAPTEEEIMATWTKFDKTYVTIRCNSFNHENYIESAILGFLNQVTNFKFEIVIHDDASEDKTPDIIRYYQSHYPRIIKHRIQSQNKMKKGCNIFLEASDLMEGEYTATCEGDDYWISQNKIQAQLDYFKSEPDALICGTRSYTIKNNDPYPYKIIPSFPPDSHKNFNYPQLLVTGVFIKTLTRMAPTHLYQKFHKEVLNKDDLERFTHGITTIGSDQHFFFYIGIKSIEKGAPILMVEEPMGVYREHPTGMHTGNTDQSFSALKNLWVKKNLKAYPTHREIKNQCKNNYCFSLARTLLSAKLSAPVIASLALELFKNDPILIRTTIGLVSFIKNKAIQQRMLSN